MSMKKKILNILLVLAFTATAIFIGILISNTASASQKINPDCPNGCIDDWNDGCYCHKEYKEYREAIWIGKEVY